MYVNRISVAASEKEGFIKLECIAPKLEDGQEIKELEILESNNVIMSRDMLKDLASMIMNVIGEGARQEK